MLALPVLLLAGCATGTLAGGSDPPSSGAFATAGPIFPAADPTMVVTVPDLAGPLGPAPSPASTVPTRGAAAPSPSATPLPAPTGPALARSSAVGSAPPSPADLPEPTGAGPETSRVGGATSEPASQPAPAGASASAPADRALPISLARCKGCSVLATHRNVSGVLSAALVVSSAGRALLLSVAPDGKVSGVIGVPYGASFPAPADGVLACDALAHCLVQGAQPDGRAILSAFELTGSGAWRDVSGDDAFPSATERAAVVDLGNQLGLAVQDEGDGPAVWVLYRWGTDDRYTVVGCAADGEPPASAAGVSPDRCLS